MLYVTKVPDDIMVFTFKGSKFKQNLSHVT